ncbi:YcaO-like family protein [Streptomyces sp. NPDC057193]|uniref:YcaO-like family protein n=1 Tax=Streptomyces sp. NPDC057193 TaxID=3346043 RepID=UPI00363E01C4
MYGCELARAPVGTPDSRAVLGSAGTSLDPDEALRRALGEAVERYSSLDFCRFIDPILMAPSEGSLPLPKCASIENCPNYLKDLSIVGRIPYVMMQNLADGTPCEVPAAWVQLGFQTKPEDPCISLPISTGSAFDFKLSRAIWKGLCEATERDAMMLMWWLRLVPRRLTLRDCLPEPIDRRIANLERAGLRAHIFDITSDINIPTMFCLVCGPSYPYMTAGAGCGSDPIVACTKSIDEAVSVRVSANWDYWSREIPSFVDFEWVRHLDDHMMLYASWSESPAADFLLNSSEEVSFAELLDRGWIKEPPGMAGMRALAHSLTEYGLTVLWQDQTVPDIEDIGYVVKVFVPEFIPLSQDHRVRWLGSPRMQEKAKQKNIPSDTYNDFPHPFS